MTVLERLKAAFLSTPSARRATAVLRAELERDVISIHALCEEGDAILSESIRERDNFYPRPLRGGRRRFERISARICTISIHALCEEGDILPCIG